MDGRPWRRAQSAWAIREGEKARHIPLNLGCKGSPSSSAVCDIWDADDSLELGGGVGRFESGR